MKKFLLVFCLAVAGIFCSNEVHASQVRSSEFMNLTDTVVFDLSLATYSSNAGVFYIDIPILIHSNATGINAIDFWFQFNLNKLTYVSTTALVSGLDPFSNFNVNNLYLSNTTSGTSVTYSAPLYTQLLMLRFSLVGACTEVYPSDFFSATALVNGNISSYLFNGPSEIPPIQVEQTQPYCSPDSIEFSYPYFSVNGRTISTYAWDFGNGQTSSLQNDTAVYNTSGDYPVNLTLTTVDGCVYSIDKTISVYPSPIVMFSSSYDAPSNVVSFSNESTIESGSINLYTWDFGSSTSNLQNPDYTFPAMGYYDVTLTATSDLGCTSSITQLVSATDNVIELSNRNFNLYPNPTNNLLNIESSFSTIGRITDVSGRIITDNLNIQSNQVFTIDVSDLSVGVYFFEARNEEFIARNRFIVED
jgi:PKD repeat protein